MVFQITLVIHIVSGFLALLYGAIAIVSHKGDRNHKISGKSYVIAMYLVGISAIIMTQIKPNPFLFTVGVFTLYLTYAGNRSIFYYRLKESYGPSWKDILPNAIGLLVSFGMVALPVFHMVKTRTISVSVMGIFGLILMIFAGRDLAKVIKDDVFAPHDKTWLIKHIGMVGGAYIATLTAFLVTNIQFSPGWVIWLLPTLVGSILIAKTSRDWKKKLKIGV